MGVRRRSTSLPQLALLILALLASGCTSLGVRTDGASGPIVWRAENIKVVTREIRGKPVDGQSFTLVLRNVSDRTVTFTQMEEIQYRPRTGPGVASHSGRWVLRPNGEWKLDRFTSLVCNSASGCTSGSASQGLFRIVLTGTDEQGRDVEAQLDITLPPAATNRPPIMR